MYIGAFWSIGSLVLAIFLYLEDKKRYKYLSFPLGISGLLMGILYQFKIISASMTMLYLGLWAFIYAIFTFDLDVDENSDLLWKIRCYTGSIVQLIVGLLLIIVAIYKWGQ